MSDDESSSHENSQKKGQKKQAFSMQKLLEMSIMNEFDPGCRYRFESLTNKSACTPCLGVPFHDGTQGGEFRRSMIQYNELVNEYSCWVLALPRSIFVRDPCTFDEINPHCIVHGSGEKFRCLVQLFLFAAQICIIKFRQPDAVRLYIEKVVYEGKENDEDSKNEYVGWRLHLFFSKLVEQNLFEVIQFFIKLNTTDRAYPPFLKGLMVSQQLLDLTNDKFITLISNYLLLNPLTRDLFRLSVDLDTMHSYIGHASSCAVLHSYLIASQSSITQEAAHMTMSSQQERSAGMFYPLSGQNYFPFPHLVWRIWQIDDFNFSRFLHSYFPDYVPINAITSVREFTDTIRRGGFATPDGNAIGNVFQISNMSTEEIARIFPDEAMRNAMLSNPLLPSQLVSYESLDHEVRRVGRNTWIINQEAAFSWVTRYAKHNFSMINADPSQETNISLLQETRKNIWSAYKKYFDPHTERMAESHRSVSEYVNTVLSSNDFQQQHLATLIDPDILPTNLSYGNAWHAFEMCFYEEVLNSMYTHKATFLLFRASLISTVNNAMNIHVLIPGSPATGKSFMLDRVRFNCLVPGTWYEFATATEKTETAFTAEMVQNRTLVYHEIPAGLVGIRDKNEAPSDREQLMKTLISEGEAMFSELKYDNSAAKRKNAKKGFTPPDRDMYIRKIPGNLAILGCLNESFDKISEPIQTRFCVQYVQYQHRDDGKSFDEAVISYKVDADLQHARCHPFRLLQSLHFAVMYAMDCKLLPEVDTTIAIVYLLYMFRVLKSFGFDTNKNRHASRFMQIIRCETIVEAIRKVFFSPVFQCMIHSKEIPWDYTHLELVTPFLVATEDILFRCMGMYIQQYVDPIELLVIRLFRQGFFPNRLLACSAQDVDRDFLVSERLQHWRPQHANEENYDYLVLPVRVVPEHHELAARLMLIENSPIKTVKSVFQKAIQSLMSRRIRSFGEHSCNTLFGRRCDDHGINPSQLAFFKTEHVFFEKLNNGSEARRERIAYVVHKSLLTLTGNRIVNDLIEGCFHYHIRTMIRTPHALLERVGGSLEQDPASSAWFSRKNEDNNQIIVWDVALCFSLFLEHCYHAEVEKRIRRARIRREDIHEEILMRRHRTRHTAAAASSRESAPPTLRSAINLNAIHRNAFARASNASEHGSASMHRSDSRTQQGAASTVRSFAMDMDEPEAQPESWNDGTGPTDATMSMQDMEEEFDAQQHGYVAQLDINIMSIDEPTPHSHSRSRSQHGDPLQCQRALDAASNSDMSDLDYRRIVQEFNATRTLEDLKRELKELDIFLFAIQKRKSLPTSLLYQDVVARRKMTLRNFVREPMSNANIQYFDDETGGERPVDTRDPYIRRQMKSWFLFSLASHPSQLMLRRWKNINTQVVEHFYDFVHQNKSCCRIASLSRNELGDILDEIAFGTYMCDEPVLAETAMPRVLPDHLIQSVTVEQGLRCMTWMHVDVRVLQYIFRHRRYVVTGEQIVGQPHLCNLLPVLPKPFFLRVAASSVFDDDEMEDYMSHRDLRSSREHSAQQMEQRYQMNANTEEFLAEQARLFLERQDGTASQSWEPNAGAGTSQPPIRPLASIRSTVGSPFDVDIAMRLHGIRDSKLFVLVTWDLEEQVIDKFLRVHNHTDLLGFEGLHAPVLRRIYETCASAANPVAFEDLLYIMRKETEDMPRKDLYNKFSNVVYVKTSNQQAYPFALMKNCSEGKLIHKIPMQEIQSSAPGSNAKREVFRNSRKTSASQRFRHVMEHMSNLRSFTGEAHTEVGSQGSFERTLASMRDYPVTGLDDAHSYASDASRSKSSGSDFDRQSFSHAERVSVVDDLCSTDDRVTNDDLDDADALGQEWDVNATANIKGISSDMRCNYTWEEWQRDSRLLEDTSHMTRGEFKRRFPLQRLLYHRDENGRVRSRFLRKDSITHLLGPTQPSVDVMCQLILRAPATASVPGDSLHLSERDLQRVLRSFDR